MRIQKNVGILRRLTGERIVSGDYQPSVAVAVVFAELVVVPLDQLVSTEIPLLPPGDAPLKWHFFKGFSRKNK